MRPASEFVIEPSTEIDMNLLKRSKISLPELVLAIRNGITLAGSVQGRNIAVSIAEQRAELFEIVYFAVDPEYQNKGYGRELLLHTLDYISFFGGQHVEVGAGNANVQMFTFLQRAGFRVAGVVRDYYNYGNDRPEVENSIVNRDMIRYHADLQALRAQR